MEEGNLSVLIVDDEAEVREIIHHYLQKYCKKIEEASDGQQALELLKAQEFDYVITDIRMPNLSGDQMILEMKKNNINTKIIVITGALASQYSKEQRLVIRSHADGYLKKPFSKDSIHQLIKDLNAHPSRSEDNKAA